jgi:2',3'-cyclic-nucleotide 2'-phosphodiesterase (5'-nucleotidase family)
MQEAFMDHLGKNEKSRKPMQNRIALCRIVPTIVLVLTGFLLLCSTSLWAKDIEIRILYINDFHGFAQGYNLPGTNEHRGNIACLAALTEKLRMEKPSLLVASGDMIQGDNWANFFQGKSVIDLMNQMSFDAMSVGNHEFDYGSEILKERIMEANFPVLGANVRGMGNFLQPYVIREIEGIRIALIGIITEDTPVTTNPKNVAGLTFASPGATLPALISKIQKEADVIIVLSHIGFNADRQLASAVSDIDVIIGGHSHTRVDKPVLIGKTVVVQDYEHGKTLGVLDLTISDGKVVRTSGYLTDIKPDSMPKDKTIADNGTLYQARVDAVMQDTVGETKTDLDGVNVRKAETNLGNFIADVMKEASGSNGAIINGGTIRRGASKGILKVSDIYSIVPFDNYIVAIRLHGKQIRDTLEHGVSAIADDGGRFPQISGIRFTFKPNQKTGSRVSDIFIGNAPLDPEKEYTIATNDFLAAGGDGFKAFGEAVRSSRDYAVVGGAMKGEKLLYSNAGKWLRDVVIDRIRAAGIIAPTVEGRIREIP